MAEVPQNFLFRLRFQARQVPSELFNEPLRAEALDVGYRIGFWSQYELPNNFNKRMGEPEQLRMRSPKNDGKFDFRFGWAPEGLVFTIILAQKTNQTAWTRLNLHSADSLRVCIDTRDVKENRRANKFCHKFIFYPFIGETLDGSKPLAQWLPINRARAIPNPVEIDDFRLASERRRDGYAFSIVVPSHTLTGFDANEFDRIGMHYVARDSQHGAFVLQYAEPAPCEEDPSLWASFVLKSA